MRTKVTVDKLKDFIRKLGSAAKGSGYIFIESTRIATLLIAGVVLAFPAAAEEHRIGVIQPLTGPLATSGEAVQRSIALADQLYDKKDEVHFIFEDDGFLPKNSVAAAKKFIAEGVEAVIIFGTPTALAVAPVTEQAKMPLAAISILDKVVQGRECTVRHFVAWQEENRRVIQEAVRRGYRRVAVVAAINDASLALRDGFVRDASAQIVLSEEFQREEMDFRTVAARIRGLKPDAVYHLLFAPQGSAFMKALREAGYSAPVFAVHNVEDPQEVTAAVGAYEGIWYVTGDDRAGRFYAETYRTMYGQYPAMGGANAFDLAKMIIEAVDEGVPVLQKFKTLREFDGAFGRYGAAPGNTFDLRATLRSVRGGQFVEGVKD